jgi:hypothetical protein
MEDGALTDRMCIVTRQVKDEGELIRFVLSPAGAVVPDVARRLPGRGVWVSAQAGTVAEAVRKRLFNRGFGAEAKIDGDLAGQVADLLRRQALGLCSLARKAGEAVTGFMKVEDALKRGSVQVLLHAAEASDDGKRKLDRLAGPETTVLNLFSGPELDLAFGRANVIHAALTKGGLAGKLLEQARKLQAYGR